MLKLILVSIISFIGGALLMNSIETYYFRKFLTVIQDDPKMLKDPEVQEALKRILNE